MNVKVTCVKLFSVETLKDLFDWIFAPTLERDLSKKK
jgi:hypothetical protein